MADQFTKVTKTSYGSRIVNSIKGIGFGLLLFFASFVVLYWNEGAVNKAEIAENAVVISADQVDASVDGELVSVSGSITSDEKIGDDMYLKPGEYLAVTRNAEMYAWVEHTTSETETKLGGSQETTTKPTYAMEWTSMPRSAGDFMQPEGHANPPMIVDSYSGRVSAAKLGAYDVDFGALELAGYEDVVANDVNIDFKDGTFASGNYVYWPVDASSTEVTPIEGDEEDFFGETETVTTDEAMDDQEDFFGETAGTEDAVTETTTSNSARTPQLGDIRISYSVVKNGVSGTVLAKLEGSKLVAYVSAKDDNAKLFRFMKVSTKDEAVAQLDKEHSIKTWIFRAIGFFMMWIGFSALFAPISVLLDVVPFFGSLSRGLIGTVTFLVSLVLSVVTIVVSMILHSVVAVLIAIAVVVGVVFFIMKKKGKNAAAPTA